MWPSDAEARAVARSTSAEMHSGFVAPRNEMSMELLAHFPTPPIGDELARDISRIVAIWCGTRARYGAEGPFLFGAFSNADAVYAPVATRFRTYGVDLAAFGDDGKAAGYAEAILASPEMAEWTEGRSRGQGAARALRRGVRTSWSARRRPEPARPPAPA